MNKVFSFLGKLALSVGGGAVCVACANQLDKETRANHKVSGLKVGLLSAGVLAGGLTAVGAGAAAMIALLPPQPVLTFDIVRTFEIVPGPEQATHALVDAVS